MNLKLSSRKSLGIKFGAERQSAVLSKYAFVTALA